MELNDIKYIRDTSNYVADKIISMANIELGLKPINILEPSAGTGKIINRLFETYNVGLENTIDCIELNKDKCNVLRSKKYPLSVHQEDFLNINIEHYPKYDRIIACPPFKSNIDIEHIKKMYTMLKPKGIMVTLTSPYWITNNELNQVAFREWLNDKEYYFKMLPDNSFREKWRTEPTGILKIIRR